MLPIMRRRPGCTTVFRWLPALLLFGCQQLAAASNDTWIEVRSPNFTVISNAGEKEGLKIADQFEQFREVFHASFPKLRVDLGKPLLIFAVKNEDSLKLLLPGYWEVKGHVHPAGIYAPGEDRHFVALRTDIESSNPYEIVYHEYTHAIMNLNFQGLPVWLGEGLAEFFGNSTIRDRDVEIGKIAPPHLQVLQEGRLIPIDSLLLADDNSPYYNEQNRASVFYAESWAIVHYLLLDPEARKRQLLHTFLSTWDATGNQLEAAEKTFGDLRKFSTTMEAYAEQRTFNIGNVKTSIRGDPKSYASRVLAPAELDADRALFYTHTQRPKEAMAAAGEAIRADPNLSLGYEALGILEYSQQEYQAAEEAFDRAIELKTTSYIAYYFAAETRLRRGSPSEDQTPKLVAYLEKTTQLNPEFAPAYSALSFIYSVNPETQEKAFAAGRKAIELEPGNLGFATSYGYVLLNAAKSADARILLARIQKAARTPAELENARQLAQAIASREEYDTQVATSAKQAREPHGDAVVASDEKTVDVPATSHGVSGIPAAPTNDAAAPPSGPSHAKEAEYAVEGNIAAADCGNGSGKLTLSVNKSAMNFRIVDFGTLEVLTTAKRDSGDPPACANWKGRRARLYFYKWKGKEYTGELNTIQFF